MLKFITRLVQARRRPVSIEIDPTLAFSQRQWADLPSHRHGSDQTTR